MRRLLCSIATLCLCAGCGSGSSSGNNGSGGGGGGGASNTGSAQVRFLYQDTWKDHLGCTSVSDYRIKFGAVPTPITVPIDVTSGSPGQYVALEGRTYKDADVLHIFTCGTSSKQDYGLFGTDLALAPSKRYTVTLGGTAATLAEDP